MNSTYAAAIAPTDQANNNVTESDIDRVCRVVARKDFCFLPATRAQELLRNVHAGALEDWKRFQESWSDLHLDGYMADGGKYRKRRHATLNALPSSRCFQTQPHQPHYQSLAYNSLNGGLPRHYQPIGPDILAGPTMHSLITLDCEIFGRLSPYSPWHIEVHQFRIEGNVGEAGKPTPKGVHRDGVSFVMMVMVQHANLVNGCTTIHDRGKARLAEFTLQQPMDIVIVNDERVLHSVTPFVQLDIGKPAIRDVLVITFHRKS
jgi:hypothetical protein